VTTSLGAKGLELVMIAQWVQLNPRLGMQG